MSHSETRTRAFLLLVFAFAACETPRPPADAPQATASVDRKPAVRDRTIWDGLPASRPELSYADPSPGRRRSESAPSATARTPPVRAVVASVRGMSFDDEPLDQALRRVQLVTGAPIVISPQGRQVIAEQGLTVTLDVTSPLRLDSMLNLFAAQSDELGWKVEDDVIWFTTKVDARGQLRLQMYDVRDLVMAMPSFPGPKMRLPNGVDEYESSADEDPTPRIDPDQLVDLIKNATDPDYWDDTEGASIEITQEGVLLVRADAAMHRRIGGALR